MEFHYLDKKYVAKFSQEDERFLADQLSKNVRQDGDLLLTMLQVLSIIKVDHSLINVMRKEGYIAKDPEYIDLMNHIITTTDVWGLLFSQGLTFSKEHLSSWALFIIKDDLFEQELPKKDTVKTDKDDVKGMPKEEEVKINNKPEIMNLFTFFRDYLVSKDTDKVLMQINHAIKINDNLEVQVKFRNNKLITTKNNELFRESVFVQENREFVEDTKLIFEFDKDVSDKEFKCLEMLFDTNFKKTYTEKVLKDIEVATKDKNKKEVLKKIITDFNNAGKQFMKDYTKDELISIIRVCHELDMKFHIVVLCSLLLTTHNMPFKIIKEEIKKIKLPMKITPC